MLFMEVPYDSKVEHLTGGYGKRPVIEDINFELKAGEIVGLIGLNGACKSTTIKHMLGLLTPTEGNLSISNTEITDDIEVYRKSYLIYLNHQLFMKN